MRFVASATRRRCTTTPRCIAGRSSIPENFWGSLWDFCEVRAEDARHAGARGRQSHAGARWFLDARFNYAENLLRLDDDGRRSSSATRAASAASCRGGSCAAKWHVSPKACGSAGVATGDRVAAYCRTFPKPSSRCSPRPASARSGLPAPRTSGQRRARSLRADHAESAVRRRRLSVRRQDLRLHGDRARRSSRGSRASNASCSCRTCDSPTFGRSTAWSFSRLRPRRCDALLRAAAVRSSRLHSLFFRHDRRAEMHRAQRRRRAAAAAEGARAARGHGAATIATSISRPAAG